jgi:hypothetical protein
MLVFSGLIPLLVSGIYYGSFIPDWANVAFLAFVQAIYVGLGILQVSGLWRETWTFDDEGVTYQPRKGREKRLSWAHVERVRWTGIKTLKGNEITIRLLLLRFGNAERQKAIGFVETKLAADFDLRPVPPKSCPRKANLDLSDPRWKVLAIGYGSLVLGLIALLFATALAPLGGTEFLLKVIRPLCFGILILAWPFWLVSTLLPVLLFGRSFQVHYENTRLWRQKVAQIHPAWPWRLRKRESMMLAKKACAGEDFNDWSH